MLDAKSLFSESYYSNAYPEVANAVAKGAFGSAFDHYQKFGKLEGRDPGPFYDDSFYLEQNPGLADAIRTGAMSSAFDHFILYGQKEARNASLLYNDEYYLSHQPDVAAAVKSSTDALTGQKLTGIEQYIKTGLNQGHSGSLEFDPDYYVQNNPGLKAANLTNKEAADHFAGYGIDEGRRASSGFDVQYYLNSNPDLKAAGFTYEEALQHYFTNGIKENRVTRPGFVAAGTTNGEITMGVQYLSSTKPPEVGICNPGMSLTNGTSQCPVFTEPSYVGTALSFFPKTGAAQLPDAPWTPAKTDPVATVKNDSNYAVTKVVYGNVFSDTQPNFKLSDVEASSSDIFGKITYDPNANLLTLESGDKTGVLPGKSWDIFRHFIAPQELENQVIREYALITFTPPPQS